MKFIRLCLIVIIFTGFQVLLFGANDKVQEIQNSYYINDLCFLGEFRNDDASKDEVIPALGDVKKRAGRFFLSAAVMEFDFKVSEKYNNYVMGFAFFSKGNKAQIDFLKENKILRIRSSSYTWFFYYETAFTAENRSRIETIFKIANPNSCNQ